MPKPKGKSGRKAPVAVSEVVKGAELADAVVADANGLNEGVGDAISKPNTSIENDVAKEVEAPVKATNGRGGRARKAADNKPVKEDASGKKAVAAAPKGRGGRGKKLDDVEVIAEEVEENAQSNGVSLESMSVEEVQQEVGTKGKAAGGRGKRGAKAAAAKESAVENGEAKENGDAEADTVKQVVTKTSKGRGGKKAAKDTVEDLKVSEPEEITTKTEEPEIKVTAKKTGGRKKKADDIAVTETAIEKEISEKSVFDLLKQEDESLDEKDEEPEEIISEQETEPAETQPAVKKTSGRKKKADDKASTEEVVLEKETNGKSLFDLLKEETEAAKIKDAKPKEDTLKEDSVVEQEEPETKPATKKAQPKKGGRKKTDDKTATETVVENVSETNGKTVTDIPKEDDEEPPKKKGRGGRKVAAVNKVEETKAEEDVTKEIPEVSKKTTKRGAKVEAEIPDVEKKVSKKGAKAQETTKEDDDELEVEKKASKRGAKAQEIPKVEDEVENKALKKGAKTQETPKAEEVEIEVEKKSSKRGAKAQETPKEEGEVEIEKKPTKRGRGAVAKAVNTAEVANEEAAPKKRSRKEPSVEKELKPEVEKPKKGRAAAGKRKAEKVEEDVVEQPQQQEEDDSKVNVPTEATEDALTKKPEKAATTSRGGRKRAAPSTNKSKTDADEDTDKNTAAAEALTIEDDEDEADGSKSSKAKKKKKESLTMTAAAPMNATITKYNKADFELAPLADGQTTDEPRFNLKISSWNVAGLRAWLKKEGLKFMEYEAPDIFCLQETKCVTDQLPEEVARIPGYHPYWLCMPGGYAGVAIYSKIMPINVEYGIGHKEFDDVGRVITAEYEKFFLINVYVPNSGRKLVNLEARMKWEKLFQEFVQKFNDHKPVVICGDMNVSHQEIDLANPKTNTRSAGFTKEEREKMSELLALGYVDTFRHLYPERTGAYTFWTYMGNARARNIGWRLDYFIVSERFTKRVVDNCIRTQCLGSDHCPITLFLKL